MTFLSSLHLISPTQLSLMLIRPAVQMTDVVQVALVYSLALADAAVEISRMQPILQELIVLLSTPPLLLSDNISVTYLATNPVLHARTKHIEIGQHFLQDKIMQHQLLVHHVSSDEQIADVFTKDLPTSSFLGFGSKLTVLTSPAPPVSLRGGVKT